MSKSLYKISAFDLQILMLMDMYLIMLHLWWKMIWYIMYTQTDSFSIILSLF